MCRGNYNTSGVSNIPAGGSTLNNGGYLGPQIPVLNRLRRILSFVENLV